MSGRRRTTVLLALAPLALALGGCADGHVDHAGGVSVLVAAHTKLGMDALGGGTLEVVGGCLGTDGYVVVWPDGTEVVQVDPLAISLPDGSRHAVGDDVRIGGGFVVEHSGGESIPDPVVVGEVEVPRSCAAYDVFLAGPG